MPRLHKVLHLFLFLILMGCNGPIKTAFDPLLAPLTADSDDALVGESSNKYPARPQYSPGEIVDYIAQTGDTLPALVAHFNTSEKEIREANPILPQEVTTLPAGFPMKIPIYYRPLWGNPYQIIPDSLFINGPAQQGFDVVAFVNQQPGWLKNYSDIVSGEVKLGGELVKQAVINFSISPRILLAILEYQTHALTQSENPYPDAPYPLHYQDRTHRGLYQQIVLLSNTLNNGYYGWRTGKMIDFEHVDGRIEVPDPWQNSATVALQYHFSQVMPKDEFEKAISPEGLAKTYADLFGDPWKSVQPHIPGSLQQPVLLFPFLPGKKWAFTGGPHTGWGEGEPWAAIDFAPPSTQSGCAPTLEVATAVANGVVTRTGNAVLVLDLDGDGDERTGWVIFYLHLAGIIPPPGTALKPRDPVGLPSCEGGTATGTHVHIARKFNGEWIPAGGAIFFNLEGWSAQEGSKPYEGTLIKFSNVVKACTCSDAASQIQSVGP
jgi:LasA protease